MEASPPVQSIQVDEESPSPTTAQDGTEQEKLEKQSKRTNTVTIIVMVLILATFGFQGLAIGYHTDSVIVIVSGVISAIVASTAGVKQVIMRRMDTLRMVHNKIRSEVNRFMEENNKLTRNVDGLEDEVIQLQDIEKQLNGIAERTGSTAKELIALVKENSAILKQQKILAKADLQEQLLATVLRTDRDGNLQIDEREASILILRMRNHGGLEFDEERVRNALVKTNGSLPALLRILRQIGKDGDEEVARRQSRRSRRVSGLEDIKEDEEEEEEEELLVRVDERKFMESVKMNYSHQSILGGIDSFHESSNFQ